MDEYQIIKETEEELLKTISGQLEYSFRDFDKISVTYAGDKIIVREEIDQECEESEEAFIFTEIRFGDVYSMPGEDGRIYHYSKYDTTPRKHAEKKPLLLGLFEKTLESLLEIIIPSQQPKEEKTEWKEEGCGIWVIGQNDSLLYSLMPVFEKTAPQYAVYFKDEQGFVEKIADRR